MGLEVVEGERIRASRVGSRLLRAGYPKPSTHATCNTKPPTTHSILEGSLQEVSEDTLSSFSHLPLLATAFMSPAKPTKQNYPPSSPGGETLRSE